MTGKLYIIATPIGNLEDITLRALRILREDTDIVYCEDTRQTSKLLQHYGISIPAQSLHAHSGKTKLEYIISQLLSGKNIAYCTDSGTPAISDPGGELVALARHNNIPVIPIPGASAVTALVSVCGFPSSSFYFAGFLSKKQGKRKKQLQQLGQLQAIVIVYESPYRIVKLLYDIAEIMPQATILIGREMTKHFEEFIYFTAAEVESIIPSLHQKGEFVIALYNEASKH
ncbi:MAG TPA: 16S rRNA (cytidine(1402)-2'-O)-methyltransferase [Spirochaetota bacterium]|nr:16S rRNA (cytidine(1402)-2'-O)-methyltransferase [Spirochaetota bacterium]HOR93712.1 16S rRNA (cytidine(1402)-2'-O)-methyltransferase [Spirochaetota bacterium]HOT18559.1 16S rRNA (cytidine(1402)-2'-O)-methyltransferase [Spirochaetota bacterium]HPD03638.1 16S rRNA (cytidine(1402)-2'-O)-methyltransferase [Spirochaetota bacterium]HQG43005.1 16S rRNA (cytidine(1402)-2'-O)-methyltransferase [Spirochaetota bacterium]